MSLFNNVKQYQVKRLSHGADPINPGKWTYPPQIQQLRTQLTGIQSLSFEPDQRYWWYQKYYFQPIHKVAPSPSNVSILPNQDPELPMMISQPQSFGNSHVYNTTSYQSRAMF